MACKSCGNFSRIPATPYGECRANSPKATIGEAYHRNGDLLPTGTAVWPLVNNDYWCNEWINAEATMGNPNGE